LIALSRGWPTNAAISAWADANKNSNRSISWDLCWHVGASIASVSWLSEQLRKLGQGDSYVVRTFAEARPVFVSRIRRDDEVATWLVNEIEHAQAISLVITALDLLRGAGHRCERLSKWLRGKALELAASSSSAQFGFDPMTDSIESMPHAILHSLPQE
jgi:hypothetical protein